MTTLTSSAHQPDSRAAANEVVIKCMGVSKVFRDFWMRNRVRAVDNIDMEVRRGEVFGLLGPNGSGKSTTIKMILGLLNPSAGRIAVFGHRPEDVATKSLIGYLPEESYLYRFLNARETLEYYGRLFHQGRHQSAKRIDMLLEMVGLDGAQRRPIGEYSKGMQRRIGLAQALINDPQLLILDEPTTGLDPIGTRQIKDLIVGLARRGKTILLCSHLLSDVEDVCDRVSIMFGGKIRAMGTVDELLVKQDQTTIQTPRLDPAVIQQIEAVLERNGKAIDSVEHPRQKLEALFLEIVQRAQAEGLSTSGARAGGKIAQFLVGDEEAPSDLVDRLVKPAAEPAPLQPTTPAAPAAPLPAQEVLDELLEPRAPAPLPETSAAASVPAEPEQLPVDLDAIQDLISPAPAAPAKASPASPPPAAKTPPPAAKPAPHDDSHAGEKPDPSFLDAISKVAPFDPKNAPPPAKPRQAPKEDR